MKLNNLTPEERNVIVNKGTERPFTGEYTDNFAKGTYIFKQCNSGLISKKMSVFMNLFLNKVYECVVKLSMFGNKEEGCYIFVRAKFKKIKIKN